MDNNDMHSMLESDLHVVTLRLQSNSTAEEYVKPLQFKMFYLKCDGMFLQSQ